MKVIKYSLFILVLLVLITCQKEEIEERAYPRVTTHEVRNITSNGATFVGEVLSKGNVEIIDCGFMWGSNPSVSINNGRKYSLGSNCKHTFTKDVTFSLVPDALYYVRSYVQTGDYLVFGEPVRFVSLGSMAPKISETYPNEATWNDTIALIGENFSVLPVENKIKFNEFPSIVVSSSDTILRCIVPDLLNNKIPSLSLSVYNNTSIANDEFRLKAPVIYSLSSDSGVYKDTIGIYGNYFKENMTNVYFGDVESELLFVNDTLIRTEVPANLEMGKTKIKVNVAGNETVYNNTFKSLTPVITSVSSDRVLYGDTVSIYGRNFNPVTEYNNVYLNNSNVNILEHLGDTISFILPLDVDPIDAGYVVSLEVGGITEEYSTPLPLKKTRINSVSNNNIVIGDTITIYGTNFHPLTDYNQVLIGDVNAEVLEISLSYLKIIVPYNIHSGTNDLQINTYGQYAFIADYLKLLTPQIIGITPEDGCREMEISIIGENFSLNKDYNKVILNEDTVEVLRSSRDTIWFKIDNFIEEGIKNVTLKVGNQTKTSSNLYNHTEPWKKLKDYPGKGRLYLVSFSINGKIYMGGGRETIKNNTVVYDFWEYDPTNDIWIKKADIPINGNNGVSFSTTNKGYCLKEKVLWCYDPVNNLWEEKSIFPGQAEYYQFAFVVNDRVFLGHGGYKIYNSYFYSFELWEYKESNNTWARRSDFPIEESSFMGFSVGSSGFMGSLKPGEFWEYDINTDVWKQNTDFSYQERMVSPSIAVATSNKGYVMTGKYSYLDENEIFEFDPVTKWKKRLSMPTQNYRFSLRGTNLNDKIYVGTGRDDDYNYNYYNDFYEYDPSKDIFEEVP